VFSEDGHALAQKTCPYPPFQNPCSSWAEISAEAFWRTFNTVIQTAAAEATKDQIEVLAVSSHGETFVPVNSSGEAIAPAILNFDNRAIAEANALTKALGKRHIFEITGLTSHPMYPVPKMLWLREHQPNMYSSIARFLAIPAYVLSRLGLPAYVDHSLASRYLAFDIHKRTWSAEILSTSGLCPEQLPLAVPAGTIAGELSASAAAHLGLRKGTLVVLGGHDQPCGALGCGVLDQGRVYASLGTYECLVAASRTPALSERALAANLNTYCHVMPERYVTLAYFPAGIMVDWFLRVLSSNGEPIPLIGELCRELEEETSAGPSGLCITPHLLGTCNPDFNPAASGVVAGIRPGTTRADLYKGILEGVACEFADMSDLLTETAGAFSQVYVSGGGTGSRLGLKLRASLSGRELHLTKCPDTVCLGTAMLGGVAAGKYGSLAEAAEHLVRISQTIGPDAAVARRYQSQRQQYQVLYSSLAPLRRMQQNATEEA
jgi:xylulokinase